MLKSVAPVSDDMVSIKIKDTAFPAPFHAGLEYAPPARGTWNIVHTGMLIPQTHQIFVCAQGCLRGVVLTAAEMGAQERFSTIAIRENNIIESDMEQLIIDGVCDIIDKLTAAGHRPRAMLVYTSCLHHFMGTDLTYIYKKLREKNSDISFVDCYMNPIMRKSGITPDALMRRQLYGLLERQNQTDDKSINIIGNNFALDETSEIMRLLHDNGFTVRDVTLCKSYDEYLDMAKCSVCITTNSAAIDAGKTVERRLGQRWLHLPVSYDFDEIEQNLHTLSDSLGLSQADYSENRTHASDALKAAKARLGDTPVYIDYTMTSRPLSLTRLLLKYGFNVCRLYTDSFSPAEKSDFEFLQKNAPLLEIMPASDPRMRVLPRESTKKVVALGQKAAYFAATPYFVNIVENGGMYGFDGICRLADYITDAFNAEKDTRRLIQVKGLGCEGCI